MSGHFTLNVKHSYKLVSYLDNVCQELYIYLDNATMDMLVINIIIDYYISHDR